MKYYGFLIYNVSLTYIAFIIFTLWLIDYKNNLFFFSYFVLFQIQYLTTKMFVKYRLLVVLFTEEEFWKVFSCNCGYSFVSQNFGYMNSFEFLSYLRFVVYDLQRKVSVLYRPLSKKTIYYCVYKVLSKGSARNGIPSGRSRVSQKSDKTLRTTMNTYEMEKNLYERTEWK